jgi:hypothetical protein
MSITTTTTYTVTPTTPQSNSNDGRLFALDLSSISRGNTNIGNSSDYQNLIQEIQQTIQKTDTIFKQIQESNYPNAGRYQSDLINFKVDTQVKDVAKTRGQIWEFINKKYNENTELKKFYYDENRKADEFILQQTAELNKIGDALASSNMKDSTIAEKLKQENYQISKMHYYRYLYIVLLFVQLACLILISAKVSGIFNGGLILALVIIVVTAVWVAYYIFVKGINRSNMSWRKVEHDQSQSYPLSNKGGMVVASNVAGGVSDEDKQKINNQVNQLAKGEM